MTKRLYKHGGGYTRAKPRVWLHSDKRLDHETVFNMPRDSPYRVGMLQGMSPIGYTVRKGKDAILMLHCGTQYSEFIVGVSYVSMYGPTTSHMVIWEGAT